MSSFGHDKKFNKTSHIFHGNIVSESQTQTADSRRRKRRSGSRTSLGSRGKSLKLTTDKKSAIAVKGAIEIIRNIYRNNCLIIPSKYRINLYLIIFPHMN